MILMGVLSLSIFFFCACSCLTCVFPPMCPCQFPLHKLLLLPFTDFHILDTHSDTTKLSKTIMAVKQTHINCLLTSVKSQKPSVPSPKTCWNRNGLCGSISVSVQQVSELMICWRMQFRSDVQPLNLAALLLILSLAEELRIAADQTTMCTVIAAETLNRSRGHTLGEKLTWESTYELAR